MLSLPMAAVRSALSGRRAPAFDEFPVGKWDCRHHTIDRTRSLEDAQSARIKWIQRSNGYHDGPVRRQQ